MVILPGSVGLKEPPPLERPPPLPDRLGTAPLVLTFTVVLFMPFIKPLIIESLLSSSFIPANSTGISILGRSFNLSFSFSTSTVLAFIAFFLLASCLSKSGVILSASVFHLLA